jgi:hypothetical protein
MFNQQQLKTLQGIIDKKVSYQSKAKWLIELSHDTGIGLVKSSSVVFGIKDIESLANYLVANDFPIESLTSDFNDRIETSKHVGNEKITGNAVTHDRVLVLLPKQNYTLNNQLLPQGRAMDFTVDEVLSINFAEVLVIENLAAFLNIMQYPSLLSMLTNDSVLVFRGMAGCYSSKGMTSFLEKFTGKKVGWFDFDPAGIAVIGHKQFDSLLVPDLNELEKYLSANKLKSDPEKYSSQKKINTPPNLAEHSRFMEINRLALSQEYMMATDFKLEKIELE